MNELQIFNSDEFGEIRTALINGKPYFVGSDVARALGYAIPHKAVREHCKGVLKQNILTNGGTQEVLVIPEGDVYRLIFRSKVPSADRFTDWVAEEVLPSIRKTGSYNAPMTTAEQIQILAQGNIELEHRVDRVEDKITNLEEDMPLYGCEIDEIQKHVKRRGVDILGGKQSEAYRDASIRGSLYSDIYSQLKREFGCVSSYKSIKRKYIADAHEFIDCYATSQYLQEQIDCANAQICF